MKDARGCECPMDAWPALDEWAATSGQEIMLEVMRRYALPSAAHQAWLRELDSVAKRFSDGVIDRFLRGVE